MGERLFYTQEVIGSIPISPTKKNFEKNLTFLFGCGTIVSERWGKIEVNTARVMEMFALRWESWERKKERPAAWHSSFIYYNL